ncbi:MAG: ATP-binding protein, partial [Acidimicrobiia bacterium]
LERQESDADALENLFRLDHLATRMRRNAENLLVLAGEQTPRRWAKPIAVRDVLRAASSEIADYRRVRLGEIDNATVSGNLATDLSHLVAELLENAGAFSPPGSPIDVLGQKTSSHYRLAIIDQGIGMDERALHEANSRLANPVDFADAPSAYLGLFVVGHLARQLNITVRLANSEPVNLAGGNTGGGGTIAFIDLPVSLLSSESATEINVATRGAARADEVAKSEAAPAPAPAPAPVVEAPPSVPVQAPEPNEETPAGFPKRVAPMVANRTDVPEPALAAATDATVTIQPPVTEGQTEAGFPKRRGADVAAVREQVHRLEAPEATPPAEPAVPDTTAAGFPKRRSAEVATPAVPETADPAPVVESQRSPESVSAALSSFRAAVAKGRQDSQQQTPPPVDPSQQPAAVGADGVPVEATTVPPALPVQPANTNSPTPGSPS